MGINRDHQRGMKFLRPLNKHDMQSKDNVHVIELGKVVTLSGTEAGISL